MNASGTSELWGTDGTASGTARLAVFDLPIAPNQLGTLRSFTRLGPGGPIVALVDNGYGMHLWSISSSGFKTLVRTFPPGGGNPQLLAAGGRAFFGAVSSSQGEELWSTDGVSASMVADVYPGPSSGFQTASAGVYEAVGDRIVFVGTDAKGFEPWVSDGTAAGTRRLLDAWPGIASSRPLPIARLDDALILSLDDGRTGREPWVLRLSALTEPAPVLGDLDADGDFDAADHSLLLASVGTQSGDFAFAISGDLNEDGLVDGADDALWLAAHGDSLTPVPTFPTAPYAWLLAVALAGVAALRLTRPTRAAP